jgi:hypothetical protein
MAVLIGSVGLVALLAACSDEGAVPGTTVPTSGPDATTPPTMGVDVPTDLTAVPASGLVMPAWRPPDSDGGDQITDYVVQVRPTGGQDAWRTFDDGVSTATAATVNGLDDGTSYDFRVAAVGSTGTSAWSDAITATPGATSAASFDFDDTDGVYPAFPNFDAATYQPLRVVGKRLQTFDDERMYGGIVAHGVDVSGDWQIDFDVHAPLGIGDGGATVGLVDPSFTGWAVFAGNATHIQNYTGGEHSNDTNDGRSAEQQHITVTRRASDGLMRVYADGVLQGSTTDPARRAGDYLAVFLQSTASPSFEVWIDNLVVKDSADD